jgi:hypothetical protein
VVQGNHATFAWREGRKERGREGRAVGKSKKRGEGGGEKKKREKEASKKGRWLKGRKDR